MTEGEGVRNCIHHFLNGPLAELFRCVCKNGKSYCRPHVKFGPLIKRVPFFKNVFPTEYVIFHILPCLKKNNFAVADLQFVLPYMTPFLNRASCFLINIKRCVFRPANGCSACHSLVEINFLMLK